MLICYLLLLNLLDHRSCSRWVEAFRFCKNLNIWFRSLIGDSTLKKQSNGISFFGPWIIEIYSSVDFFFFFFGYWPKNNIVIIVLQIVYKPQELLLHHQQKLECLLRDEIYQNKAKWERERGWWGCHVHVSSLSFFSCHVMSKFFN